MLLKMVLKESNTLLEQAVKLDKDSFEHLLTEIPVSTGGN